MASPASWDSMWIDTANDSQICREAAKILLCTVQRTIKTFHGKMSHILQPQTGPDFGEALF